LWSGDALAGHRWLRQVQMPLERMPIYVRRGARIKVYPDPIQSTVEMSLEKAATITFDNNYRGLSGSVLGVLTGL